MTPDQKAEWIRAHDAEHTLMIGDGANDSLAFDAAGCRGLTMGGAQVSEKHTNFLLNTGDATSADIEGLGEEVKRRVYEHSGVELEWEIQRVGRP